MKKILVIKTHAIGDVIMTTPAIRELRRTFPDSEISVLIGKWSSPIIKNNPHLTRCIEFDDDILHKKRILGILKLLFKLRSWKFDAAIIMHPSPFIHLLAVCAGIKYRYGLSRHGKDFFLTQSVEENGSYDFYYPMNFINVVNAVAGSNPVDDKSSEIRMEVFSNEADSASAEKLLKIQGVDDFSKLILVAPGGSVNPKENISARVWPCDYFITLVQSIALEFFDFSIVISGGKNDMAIAHLIRDQAPQVVDLSGKTTIFEIVHIIGLSQVVICNDSAVLHIGIAQNRPTVGIFGPTSMKSRVPPSHRQNCVQSAEKCSPCYYFGQFKGCNNDESCMRTILPEHVFKKVKKILVADHSKGFCEEGISDKTV